MPELTTRPKPAGLVIHILGPGDQAAARLRAGAFERATGSRPAERVRHTGHSRPAGGSGGCLPLGPAATDPTAQGAFRASCSQVMVRLDRLLESPGPSRSPELADAVIQAANHYHAAREASRHVADDARMTGPLLAAFRSNLAMVLRHPEFDFTVLKPSKQLALAFALNTLKVKGAVGVGAAVFNRAMQAHDRLFRYAVALMVKRDAAGAGFAFGKLAACTDALADLRLKFGGRPDLVYAGNRQMHSQQLMQDAVERLTAAQLTSLAKALECEAPEMDEVSALMHQALRTAVDSKRMSGLAPRPQTAVS